MLGGIVRGKLATLRTPKEDDLSFVNTLMADMRVRREGQLWGEPATIATWKERLKEAAKEHNAVLWTIEAEGAPVGFAHVSWHSEVGHCDIRELVIDPARWGTGLGTDAAIALHRYLFDYLDKRACAVELPADHTRALRIAEKIGYREFGRGHDVYYRDGGYTDQVFLRFDRETWDQRWAATERECWGHDCVTMWTGRSAALIEDVPLPLQQQQWPRMGGPGGRVDNPTGMWRGGDPRRCDG